MGTHGPLPGSDLYDVMVAAPERLSPEAFARIGVHVGNVMSLDAILGATESRLETGLSDSRLQFVNARAFSAAQETAYADPGNEAAVKLVSEHLPVQRRLTELAFTLARRQLRVGHGVFTGDLVSLLNLQHPDFVTDPTLGLVVTARSALESGGYQRPEAKHLDDMHREAVSGNTAAFSLYLAHEPLWGGRFAVDDSAMLATIMEGRLWNGQGWTDGEHVTSAMRLARAERLVRSVESLGMLASSGVRILEGLARRGLPTETKRAYRQALQVLDNSEGKAYRARRAAHREQLTGRGRRRAI